MIENAAPPLFPLNISRAEFVAKDIRLFEFRRNDGGELPVFTAGAHVSVCVSNGDTRKYSLCNNPSERERYVIALKRESGGRGGSKSLVDTANTGDVLPVSAPKNDFELKDIAAGYVFIAGGIGITPVLSMVRHLRSHGRAKFKLYYLSRSREDAAFADELSAPEFRGVVKLHYDSGNPAQMFDLWPILQQARGAHLYCCGPRGLMQSVRDMTGHWSSEALHFESFVEASATHLIEDSAFVVHLARSGGSIEVPKDKSILETLREQGVKTLSSCESGSCGTCRTLLLAGDADHRDLVLTDEERANHIMICVSRARTGDLTIDA